MPQDYIYKGVWMKYDNPAKGMTWTVTNFEALIIFAALATLFTFTQSRTWVIIRYLYGKSRPVHIPDHLDEASQWDALQGCWGFLKNTSFFRNLSNSSPTQQRRQPPSYKTSPWIGLWATLGALVFIVGGGLISWLLADGWFSAPEVRSRLTDKCEDMWLNETIESHSIVQANANWDACFDATDTNSFCDPNFSGLKMFSAEISADCPFTTSICQKDRPTVKFTRTNLTAHDLGVNSKIPMTASHRISCSPISMAPFTYIAPRSTGENFTFSIQNPSLVKNVYELGANLSLNLWTNNSCGSGLEMLKTGNSFLLEILPASGSPSVTPEAQLKLWSQINPLLTHPNSSSFVLVLRPGATVAQSLGNPQPITDPFFSASTPWVGGTGFYIPDMEATAIACIEQFQVCLDPGFGFRCYPWMQSLGVNVPPKIMQDLHRAYQNLHDVALDYASVFWRSFGASWVALSYLQEYLQKHVILQRPLLVTPLRLGPSLPQALWNVNATHQWVMELETLFTKAVIWQRILMLGVVMSEADHSNQTPWAPGTLSKNLSICDKIIFVDGDYTNIDWVWTWVSIGTLALLCIISYADSYIPWISSEFKQFRQWVRPLLETATQALISSMHQMWKLFCGIPDSLQSILQKCSVSIRGQKNHAEDVRMHNLSGRPEGEEPDNPLPLRTSYG